MRDHREAEIFGASLREIRLARGWTQEHLADAAGLTTTYVGLVERGVQVPSLTVVLKLARGLEIEPAGLLVGFTSSVLRRLRLD